jgi:hypothetical protein
MPLSRANRHKGLYHGTRKNCEHGATYHGLKKWYEAMFEKLGWMVLAKAHGGMNDKIISYKKSVERLKEKIECKIETIVDHDKKEDLKIMWDNVCILHDHIKKDF